MDETTVEGEGGEEGERGEEGGFVGSGCGVRIFNLVQSKGVRESGEAGAREVDERLLREPRCLDWGERSEPALALASSCPAEGIPSCP